MKQNPVLFQAIVLVISLITSSNAALDSATIEKKVDSLLGLMTLAEKAGQMTMVQINSSGTASQRVPDSKVASMGIGSVFNGGSDASVPANTPAAWAAVIDRVQNAVMNSSRLKIPIIYGQDCVHGVGAIAGCTVFPHNIGLGCTNDTALVAKTARITAQEAAGVGIRLNFAPCIAAARNERWGRTYEGFGETPEINALLGAAYVRGLQGNGDLSQPWSVAASAKHYLGDGATDNGVNNGTATISEATMRAVHLPPYAACAREKMATVMPSYHIWRHNGSDWRQSADSLAMKTILKKELGFDGFCVSDWDAIPQMSSSCANYAASCVAQSINAGMDMAMVVAEYTGAVTSHQKYVDAIVSGVNGNAIPLARVDDAVRRILRIKFRMNLFNNYLSSATYRGQIFSAEHRAVAREAVRKSLVLLKNEGDALPLLNTDKVVVVGTWGNDMGYQCGGWTISWQGQGGAGPGIAGQTIYAGLQEVGGSANVTYDAQGNNLTAANKIVLVVGERPYAEGNGDASSAPDFSTCAEANLVSKCANSGKPVILVMITGRPMVLDNELPSCKAVVAAWLTCSIMITILAEHCPIPGPHQPIRCRSMPVLNTPTNRRGAAERRSGRTGMA